MIPRIHFEASLSAAAKFHLDRLLLAPSTERQRILATVKAFRAASFLPQSQLPVLMHLASHGNVPTFHGSVNPAR